MKQSRRMSFAEAVANVAVGFGVAVGAQMAIFPVFGLEASMGEHVAIGGAFTVVSLTRSYGLRRIFERIRERQGGTGPPPVVRAAVEQLGTGRIRP